ncbi:hypothetical protein ACFQ14_13265 [Pseudahrensia aquimaris]|uniref:Transcriptional repressor PaaX-like N-terminal domain-containing protein n=1 Tax=Pseudahrensia aquimaris TaxID=744461 RepID=A0ABW3FHZ7_9HYPH
MASQIDLLPSDDPIKVWSVIVTLFGDLASGDGDEISGQVLMMLMERLGIRPDATRVALHRLRKDSWIVSRKVGRNAHYRLSTHGLRETQAASPRIYAENLPAITDVKLVLAAPDVETPEGIELAPRVRLTRSPMPTDWVLSAGVSTMPDWAMESLLPSSLAKSFRMLHETLLAENHAVPKDPIAQAIARARIVHAWRRLILKLDEERERLLPPGNAVFACRKAVLERLNGVTRPKISDLA